MIYKWKCLGVTLHIILKLIKKKNQDRCWVGNVTNQYSKMDQLILSSPSCCPPYNPQPEHGQAGSDQYTPVHSLCRPAQCWFKTYLILDPLTEILILLKGTAFKGKDICYTNNLSVITPLSKFLKLHSHRNLNFSKS